MTGDGKYVLLCASDDDAVQIIDPNTYEIVGTLRPGRTPSFLF